MHRVTRVLRDRAAPIDEIADIHRTVLADDDVVPTGTQCIARFDDDTFWIARVAGDVESTDNPVAMEVAIVQLGLLDDILIEKIEILIRKQLAGKEARPTEALQTSACGTGRRAALRDVGLRYSPGGIDSSCLVRMSRC